MASNVSNDLSPLIRRSRIVPFVFCQLQRLLSELGAKIQGSFSSERFQCFC